MRQRLNRESIKIVIENTLRIRRERGFRHAEGTAEAALTATDEAETASDVIDAMEQVIGEAERA